MGITNFDIVAVDANGLIIAGVPVTASGLELSAVSGLVDDNGNFTLDNAQWEDLRFPAAGINPPGAVSDPVRDTDDGRLVFSATATNMIAVQVQMPHSWEEGTELEAHIHWSPTNTNTGNVLWQLDYKVANINEAFPAGWTTLTVLQAGSGTVDMQQIADFASIPMVGKKISCMLLMKLSRVGGDASDTYTGTAKLNEFDIHFKLNSLGSKQEYIK